MSQSSHLVHGHAADQVAPVWPPLQLAELVPLFRHYPRLGAPQALHWHSPRPLSAAAIVVTSSGPVFVKRHHRRLRSEADVLEEHRLIHHLQARGQPIPALLASLDGRTAISEGEWTYELSALAAGRDLFRDSQSWEPIRQPIHGYHAGRALAAMHQAARDYSAPQRQTQLLVARAELIASPQPLSWLQAQLPQRPGLARYLAGRQWQAELAAVLDRWQGDLPRRLAATPPLWTHNDWHASNLMWQGAPGQEAVCAILDFGLSARTWAMFDLATAIERNAIAWLALEQGMAAARGEIAQALLAGYDSLQPLSAVELALVHDLLPIVHLDFALSEVEYFQTILQRPADADLAWDTFLRGHAAWFDTAPGQRLLASLRRGG